MTSFSALAFGNDDAEDVAYDTSSGDLFVTQGGAQRVWRVSPDRTPVRRSRPAGTTW